MRSAGLVAIGSAGDVSVWTGGQYYLQHLIKCVAALPEEAQIRLRDVWWMKKASVDPFAEVRGSLGPSQVISPPTTVGGRVRRKVRSFLSYPRRGGGARDLFDGAGVDVFFPVPPCENSGTPYVYWIPDFQHVRRPDLMSDELRARFTREIAYHVPKAARIVLSSFDAQRDFAAQFPQFLNQTDVVQFCSVSDESWWLSAPDEVAARYGLPRKYLIACNQFTRHKNHLLLVDTLRRLVDRGRAADVHIACTGSTYDYRGEDYVGQVRSELAKHGLQDRLSILGLVPRADQIALLRGAAAVLQPSFFEGWSTVVEDCKTLGKAIFVSDLPVHREQLADHHQQFIDPNDAQAWCIAIESSWSGLTAGPDLAAEAAGLAATMRAQKACGAAFVASLKAAASGVPLRLY